MATTGSLCYAGFVFFGRQRHRLGFEEAVTLIRMAMMSSQQPLQAENRIHGSDGAVAEFLMTARKVKEAVLESPQRAHRAGKPVSLTKTFLTLCTLMWENRLFRFLVAGGVNTVGSYLLYVLLILVGVDYRISVTILTVAMIFVNFITYGHLAFRDRRTRLILKFLPVYFIIYVVNQVALIGLVTHGVGELLAQALLIPLITTLSFFLNRRWVFRKTPKRATGPEEPAVEFVQQTQNNDSDEGR